MLSSEGAPRRKHAAQTDETICAARRTHQGAPRGRGGRSHPAAAVAQNRYHHCCRAGACGDRDPLLAHRTIRRKSFSMRSISSARRATICTAETFLDPHPPVAKLLIAVGIWLFGDHSWSWRVGNATHGNHPGRRHLSARAPHVQGSARGNPGGGIRPARWILPGRFAHRMHRYRVPDLRRDFVCAAVPFHADATAAGKAQPADLPGNRAGALPGQQTLHSGDRMRAVPRALSPTTSGR